MKDITRKHHIEIAREKLKKKQDVTVCIIIDSGIIYKGGFYPDCYLESHEGLPTYCIEVDGWLHIFMPDGNFACSYKIDKVFARKGYRKALNRMLK